MNAALVLGVALALLSADGISLPRGLDSPKEFFVAGNVVDLSGRPVLDATVAAMNHRNVEVSCRTDARGAFRLVLGGKCMESLSLVARDLKSQSAGVHRFRLEERPAPNTRVQISIAPARPVKIHVLDGNRLPVADALTEVFGSSLSLDIGRTDREGRCTLLIPSEAQIDAVVALKSNLGLDYRIPMVKSDGQSSVDLRQEVELVLDGARTLKLNVAAENGAPLAGTRWSPVLLTKDGINKGSLRLSNSRIAVATTDAAGTASFDWFPQNCPGIVRFESLEPDVRIEGEATLPGGSREGELRIACRLLSTRTRSIQGQVRSATGEPAPHVLLKVDVPMEIGRAWSSFIGFARTDSGGRYDIPVPVDERYSVGVVDDDWAAAVQKRIPVTRQRKVDGIDFQLAKGTLLRGHARRIEPESRPEPIKVTLACITPSPLNAKRPPIDPLYDVEWRRICLVEPGQEYRFRVTAGFYELEVGNSIHRFTVKDETQLVRHFTID